MAEERSKQTSTTESTEERTIPSGNVLTSDDPRFVSGTLGDVDERVESAEELRGAVDDLPRGSSILFDEAGGSTSSRRDRAAHGEDYALRMVAGLATERKTSSTTHGTSQGLSSTSTPDPFGPSRRDLAQRLDRLEGKVDALLAALDLDAGGSDE